MNAMWRPSGAQIDPRRRNSQPSAQRDRQTGHEPDATISAGDLAKAVAADGQDVGQGEEQRRPDERPLSPTVRRQAVIAEARGTIVSSAIGAMTAPAISWTIRPTVVPVAGRGASGSTPETG